MLVSYFNKIDGSEVRVPTYFTLMTNAIDRAVQNMALYDGRNTLQEHFVVCPSNRGLITAPEN